MASSGSSAQRKTVAGVGRVPTRDRLRGSAIATRREFASALARAADADERRRRRPALCSPCQGEGWRRCKPQRLEYRLESEGGASPRSRRRSPSGRRDDAKGSKSTWLPRIRKFRRMWKRPWRPSSSFIPSMRTSALSVRRFIYRATAFISRPRTLVVITAFIAGWIAINIALS